VINTDIIKEIKIVGYKEIDNIFDDLKKGCDYDIERIIKNEMLLR
jgi:hypothetical protein